VASWLGASKTPMEKPLEWHLVDVGFYEALARDPSVTVVKTELQIPGPSSRSGRTEETTVGTEVTWTSGRRGQTKDGRPLLC